MIYWSCLNFIVFLSFYDNFAFCCYFKIFFLYVGGLELGMRLYDGVIIVIKDERFL